MAVTLTLAAGWRVSVLVSGRLSAPALGASPTRIDLCEPKGNRIGSAVVEGDRVDLFDLRSNRTGSARIEAGRREQTVRLTRQKPRRSSKRCRERGHGEKGRKERGDERENHPHSDQGLVW